MASCDGHVPFLLALLCFLTMLFIRPILFNMDKYTYPLSTSAKQNVIMPMMNDSVAGSLISVVLFPQVP